MIEVDRKEIFRYLGYRGSAPDEQVVQVVESCLAQLQEAVTPRYIYRWFPVERAFILPAGDVPGNAASNPAEYFDKTGGAAGKGSSAEEVQTPLLHIAGMEICSRNLARNLRGCDSAYLMAATLGIGPDRLIARAGVTQMSRAVVLQAAAAAMIEAWSDAVNRRILAEAEKKGLYCRPRFSPGYGDFSLQHQRDFMQILRLQKEIGLSLTESLLMMPSKSVTAVIGLSGEKDGCVLHGCEACAKAGSCAFSRNG